MPGKMLVVLQSRFHFLSGSIPGRAGAFALRICYNCRMTNLPQRTEHSTFLRGAEELFLGGEEAAAAGRDAPERENLGRPGAPLTDGGALRPTPRLTPRTGSAKPGSGGRAEESGEQVSAHTPHQVTAGSLPLDAAALKEVVQGTFALVAPGLARVEHTVRSSFVTESPQLFEISRHLLETGGKRIRPILTLLTNMLFSAPTSEERFASLVKAAAGIELIHMATLLHDDIIDQSSKRRHRETAYVTYGMTPTLLAGDFLWVRAFGLCAHLGEYVVQSTERACVELTEGELMEGTLSESRNFAFEDYVQIVSKKTASLFALSAGLGAHFAAASDEDRERLTTFGREAGIAFQMVDDILDVVSTDDLLGKPAGTDLRQRTPSLVNVLWLAQDRERARRFFGAPEMTPELVEDARQQILASPVIGEARTIARERTARARAQLDAIAPSKKNEQVERHLLALLEYTLRRCL